MNDVPPVGANWAADILRFWFDEVGSAGWFAVDAVIDERIRERYGSLLQRLVTRAVPLDAGDARQMLAAVIGLDQFSRNLFRDSARAFAADPLARELASAAIASGLDLSLAAAERLFLYMPFQHSETAADQSLAVAKISALGVPEWAEHALAHQRTIERFGRFPHRNAALGRPSSVEELAALAAPPDGLYFPGR